MTPHDPKSPPLATFGLAAIAVGALVVLLLDVHTALGNAAHLRRTISEYGLGAGQWVFTIGVLLLALGSATTTTSAVRSGLATARSTAVIGLTIWTVGLLAVVIVPKQDWSGDATLGIGGAVHRFGAAAAFVGIPIGLLAVAIPWLRRGEWKLRARITAALTLLAVLSSTPIVYALIVGATSSTPWYRAVTLGYVERLLVVAEVVALLSFAVWTRAAERVLVRPPSGPLRQSDSPFLAR